MNQLDRDFFFLPTSRKAVNWWLLSSLKATLKLLVRSTFTVIWQTAKNRLRYFFDLLWNKPQWFHFEQATAFRDEKALKEKREDSLDLSNSDQKPFFLKKIYIYRLTLLEKIKTVICETVFVIRLRCLIRRFVFAQNTKQRVERINYEQSLLRSWLLWSHQIFSSTNSGWPRVIEKKGTLDLSWVSENHRLMGETG